MNTKEIVTARRRVAELVLHLSELKSKQRVTVSKIVRVKTELDQLQSTLPKVFRTEISDDDDVWDWKSVTGLGGDDRYE